MARVLQLTAVLCICVAISAKDTTSGAEVGQEEQDGQCASGSKLSHGLAAAYPLGKKRQTLHFVRHAEGFHNLVALKYTRHSEEYERALADPSYFDARLSPRGRDQCEQLREQAIQDSLEYDLILVSPLARTLQTLSIAFPNPPPHVPVIAIDVLRERYGLRPCDSRSDVEAVKQEFPHVDFSLVPPGPDPYICARGQTAGCPRRESEASMDARARELLAFVRGRREARILLVGHSAFFSRLFEKHLGWDLEDGPYRLQNAELRSIEVVYK